MPPQEPQQQPLPDVSVPQPLISQEARFHEIYNRYHLKIFNYIAKTIGNREDALDILQEVFLLFYDRLNRLDTSTSRIEAWLLRVARNLCLSYSRNKNRRLTHALTEPDQVMDHNSEDSLQKKEIQQRLDDFLDSLNDQERSIFILHKLEGVKYKDLMTIFDISPRTLKRIVAGVLNKMKARDIMGLKDEF